ncbi:MAG: AMP-binding protein, partial [Proteobacteria bacterium]|nr:AMP-binding protein [Pseudomonadota bacterium]
MDCQYRTDLGKRAANYQPLTPLTFLERAAEVYPHHPAIIHGNRNWSYKSFYDRARQLASSLRKHGVRSGDTVSAMLANTPAMLEAHFGVPMSGGVLHSLNTRLDAAAVALQLHHAMTKVLIVDREFSDIVRAAVEQVPIKPLVVDYNDSEYSNLGPPLSDIDYNDFVASGDLEFQWQAPVDEWSAISLNYTSGSTGVPKGVVYHHRGAALMCYSNVLAVGMVRHPVYLWTLPMFHCNGWCFPWTLSLVGGTHVCLRWVRGQIVRDLIEKHNVTHLCGAPAVMSVLADASTDDVSRPHPGVRFAHAAAPPPQA